jgi:hypothetical protein
MPADRSGVSRAQSSLVYRALALPARTMTYALFIIYVSDLLGFSIIVK